MLSPCDISCKSCLGNSDIKKCIECSNNYYFKENDSSNFCYMNLNGYYLNNNFTPKKLSICDVSCKECQYSNSFCTQCNSNFFPLSDNANKCVQTASKQYIFMTNIFTKCSIECLECENLISNCISCNLDFSYYPLIDNIKSCKYTCPDGYWKDTFNKKCSLCKTPCKYCQDSESNCKLCIDDYYLLEQKNVLNNNISGVCLNNKPGNNYYLDLSDKKWKTCNLSCSECENSVKCLACEKGFFFDSDSFTCNPTCKDGFYADILTNSCKKCIQDCFTCNNGITCSSCISNLYFLDINYASSQLLNLTFKSSKCYDDCPNGYFNNKKSNMCEKCYSNCLYCDVNKICSKCEQGYYLFNSKCLDKCPESFFKNDSPDRICKNCSSFCSTCLNLNVCLQCQSGYFKFNQQENNSVICLEKCPQGYYRDIVKSTCKTCDSSCLECNGPLNSNCLSCDEKLGKKLLNGYCLGECLNGEIKKKDSNECIKLDLKSCIQKIDFIYPKIYVIDEKGLEIKIMINYDKICETNLDLNDFTIKFDKVEDSFITYNSPSSAKMLLKLQEKKSDIMNFKSNVFYKENQMLNLEAQVFILEYKVI